MRFPLTERLLDEARRFGLRSACCDCLYYLRSRDRCANEWPHHDQKRWPLDAPGDDGSPPHSAEFCREFELR
jgi:hypothetical protein